MAKKGYYADPLKYGVALATCAVSLFLGLLALQIGAWIAAVLFLACAGVFGYIAFRYGTVIHVDLNGLRCTFWGREYKKVDWSEIAEVGVVGLKVFNNNDPKHTGTRYFYFSPEPMDPDSRFKLALEWPPKKMVVLHFSPDRLHAVQMAWGGRIETFNAGEIFF